MYLIRDAANAFAFIDCTPLEQVASLDKSLRHLSQRLYMPPLGRKGRADTYTLESICALRLLHKASSFGLDRWQLEKLAQFLQIADPLSGGLREKFSGGWRVLPPIRESVQRVRAGECFDIGVSMLRDGTVKPFANWSKDKADKSLPSGTRLPIDGVFTLPASRLIEELIGQLENVQ